MSCPGIFFDRSCGECKFTFIDRSLTKGLGPNSVSYICYNLAKQVGRDGYRLDLKTSYITCRAHIHTDFVEVNEKNTSETDIHIICRFIRWWKRDNCYEGNKLSSLVFDIPSLESETDYKVFKNRVRKIHSIVDDITECDGDCNKIVFNKEKSKCCFYLSNKDIISSMDLYSLIRSLRCLITDMAMTPMHGITLDLRSAYIKCDGTVHAENFHYNSDPMDHVKNFGSILIYRWMAVNASSDYLMTAKEIVRKLQISKNLVGIYTVLHNSLEKLEYTTMEIMDEITETERKMNAEKRKMK